jgi:AcrR family transcriptional regulator
MKLPVSTFRRLRPARPKRKQAYHHGDLRRALVDAALGLIARRGTGAVTLREVARYAGVSHAAPYRHFADKDALLAAVATEGFRALHDEMAAAAAAETTPRARFAATGVAYVRFATGQPAHYRVMFGGVTATPAGADPELQQAGHAAFGVLTDAIAACQQAGEVRPGPVGPLAITAWSVVHGLSMLLIDRQLDGMDAGPPEPQSLAQQVTTLVVEGLMVR